MQEHISRVKGLRIVHKIYVSKPEGKREYGRHQFGPGGGK